MIEKLRKLAKEHPEFRRYLIPLLKRTSAVDLSYIPVRLSGSEKIIAYNESYWQWEYDKDIKYAVVILDTGTGKLRLEIVGVHIKTGLGAGKREEVLDRADLGFIQKPRVGGVASILKKYSHDRTRAASPFKRVWRNAETGKEGPLKEILVSYQSVGVGQSEGDVRKELAQKIDKLPMDVVKKLLDQLK